MQVKVKRGSKVPPPISSVHLNTTIQNEVVRYTFKLIIHMVFL